MAITFLNRQHEDNFYELRNRWQSIHPEYISALYITATPIIFEKIKDEYKNFDIPLDWIYQHEWKRTLKENVFNGEDDEFHDKKYNFELTDDEVALGQIALNLWNSYDHDVNYNELFFTMNKTFIQIVLESIKIRTNLLEHHLEGHMI